MNEAAQQVAISSGHVAIDASAAANRRLLVVVALAAPVIALLGMLLVMGSTPDALFCAAGVASLSVCLLPVLAASGRIDLFHPFMLIGLSVAIGTTGRSFYICFNDSHNAAWLTNDDPVITLLPGAVLILVGCVSMVFGYFACKRVKLSSRWIDRTQKLDFSERKLKLLSILILCAAAVLNVDMLRRTDSASFDSMRDFSHKRKAELSSNDTNQKFASLGYHKLGCYTLPATIYLAWLVVWARRGRPRKLLPMIALLGLAACVYPFLISSRASIVFLLINSCVVLYACRIVGMRGILVTALVAISCLTAMRLFRDSTLGTGRITEISVIDTLFGQRNLCGVAKTAHIHNAMGESIKPHYGTTLFRWVISPIPREMWPAKPAVSLGYELTEALYGRETYKGGGTPPGFVGEMLLNFGVVGVPLGCFLLGALQAAFYNTLRGPASSAPVALLLYVLLLIPVSFHAISGEVSRNMIAIGMSMACLLLVLMLSSVRNQCEVGSDSPALQTAR